MGFSETATAAAIESFADQHDWTVRTALQVYAMDMRKEAASVRELPNLARAFFDAAEKADKAAQAWVDLVDGPDDDGAEQ